MITLFHFAKVFTLTAGSLAGVDFNSFFRKRVLVNENIPSLRIGCRIACQQIKATAFSYRAYTFCMLSLHFSGFYYFENEFR